MNRVEPAHIDPANPYATILPISGTNYLGTNETQTLSANAVLDEIRVYGAPAAPTALAHGGLGPHPAEHLSTGAKNFALALDALDGVGRGKYLYVGADARFHGLNVSLATPGVGVVDLHWEYWNGGGWVDLESVPGFVDETENLTRNGAVFWAEDPPGWSEVSINGDADLFYVRIHLESGAYTTVPVEERIATDILLLQYCGNVSAASQTFDFDLPPNPDVSISSASDQTFTVGHLAPPIIASSVTINDVTGGSITAGNDIRIRVPAGFNMRWNSGVAAAGLGGSASGKVLPDLSYEDLDRTVVLNVVSDFAAGEQLLVSNLELVSFTAPSPPDNLELEVANDGVVTAYDDKLIEIVPDGTPVLSSDHHQFFTVGQPTASAATMFVTEGLTNHITDGSDIIIRIPAGYPMLWDTTVTTAIIGGTASSRVSTTVTYEPGDRGLVIDVSSDFAPGEFISISGLAFTSFSAFALPDHLELDVGVVGDDDDKTIAIDAITDVPFFTATATDFQVELEWVTPSFGTCTEVVIVRGQGYQPTQFVHDWLTSIPCLGPGLSHSTVDGLVLNDATYNYGAFVHDGASGYSDGMHLEARPFSTAGPVKWAYSTAAASMAPPGLRFSGGAATVYAVSNDNILHAMEGGVSGGTWPAGWQPGRLGGPAQARPPVVPFTVGSAANGVAFLGAQDGKVYAIDADTGSEAWSRSIATMVQAAPAGNFAFYDGLAKDLVLVGTRNSAGANSFEALNVGDGTPAWSFVNSSAQGGDNKEIGIISASAAIDYANRHLLFASRQKTGGSANTLWCIDFDSGSPSLVWAKAIGDIDGSPLLLGNVVYVGANAGVVYALDAASGNVNWSLPLGDGAIKGFVFPQFFTNNLFVSTTGNVWSIADNVASAAVNPGWPVTSVPSPSTPTYVPGSTEVLVGGGDGKLYQLDVTTPLPPSTVTLGDGGGAVGVPTMDLLNSMIYVGTDQGVIYGIQFPIP